MSTSTAIMKKLREIAPSIHFEAEYSVDVHAKWDGDGPDPIDEGMNAYYVDVFARAVVGGKSLTGQSSLGGVYEFPNKHDPDIGGYLPQMLEEAVNDLRSILALTLVTDERSPNPVNPPSSLFKECEKAQAFLKTTLHARYRQQTRGLYR